MARGRRGGSVTVTLIVHRTFGEHDFVIVGIWRCAALFVVLSQNQTIAEWICIVCTAVKC